MERSDAHQHDADSSASKTGARPFDFSQDDALATEDKSGLAKLVATIAPYHPGSIRDVMRQQFFTSLEVERLFGAYPDDDDRRQAVNTALDGVLANRDSWRSGYCAEQLMVGLMDDDKMVIEAERRITTAQQLKIPSAGLYAEEFGRMRADDFQDQNRLRHLLLRIISDSQWRRMRSFLERQFARSYVSRINRIWMASIIVFMFSLLITEMLPTGGIKADTDIVTVSKSGKSQAPAAAASTSGTTPLSGAPPGAEPTAKGGAPRTDRPAGNPELHKLAGLLVALIMGLLGAAFSMVAMAQKRIQNFTLEDIQLQSRWEFLLLRLGFGTGAAVVLYFGFQAEIITGKLFPNIEHIGFTENRPQEGRELGDWVPNADFASLLVWSFLAGFSENFVPNFLRRAEATELDFKP